VLAVNSDAAASLEAWRCAFVGSGLRDVNKELNTAIPKLQIGGAEEKADETAAKAQAARAFLENVQQSIVYDSTGEETAYVWNREPDQFDWEANAGGVFGISNLGRIAGKSKYELLIAPEHVARRQQIFATGYGEDLGDGVPYNVRYRFSADGLRSQREVWISEQGRWWADDNGKPVQARGCIRIIPDSEWAEIRDGPAGDYDELTGQLNRIRLTSALEALIDRARTSGTNSAFLVASVSNLSIINETFGFDVGDEVLARVAKAMKAKLRGGDAIGRYSSNKFGIVLNDCGPSAMRIAADRLIQAVAETKFEDIACPIAAKLSVGGVLLPDHASTVNKALNQALDALQQARRRRTSCFVVQSHNAEKENRRRRNVQIAEEIQTALDEDRMHLVLQPVVNSVTRELAFSECLMRMTKSNGTVVSAGEFIEVAEQLGIAQQIDRHTLRLAVDLLNDDPNLHLSLNVSGLTCAEHDWLLELYNLVGTRPGLAKRLIVEITETATIHDLDQSIVFVDTVKEMGCKVAIDDFGAGYSSFKTLKHLPVDMVKIDGNFVRNLTTDHTDRVFLRTMAELAENFGLETVAEYVIDEPTAKLVQDAGLTYLQGFHLGQPRSPNVREYR
jgi:diguanylate cyclase (GGDEF)-like protein